MVWGCEFPLGAGVLLWQQRGKECHWPLSVTHCAENEAGIPCSRCTRSDRLGQDGEQERRDMSTFTPVQEFIGLVSFLEGCWLFQSEE